MSTVADGERFPELVLPDESGEERRLGDLLGSRGGVVVFYRGHW